MSATLTTDSTSVPSLHSEPFSTFQAVCRFGSPLYLSTLFRVCFSFYSRLFNSIWLVESLSGCTQHSPSIIQLSRSLICLSYINSDCLQLFLFYTRTDSSVLCFIIVDVRCCYCCCSCFVVYIQNFDFVWGRAGFWRSSAGIEFYFRPSSAQRPSTLSIFCWKDFRYPPIVAMSRES